MCHLSHSLVSTLHTFIHSLTSGIWCLLSSKSMPLSWHWNLCDLPWQMPQNAFAASLSLSITAEGQGKSSNTIRQLFGVALNFFGASECNFGCWLKNSWINHWLMEPATLSQLFLLVVSLRQFNYGWNIYIQLYSGLFRGQGRTKRN
jgi:hypothetical protein